MRDNTELVIGIILIVVAILLVIVIGIYEDDSKTGGDKQSQKSGVGMTYGGKTGIEVAPGLIMRFDGKGMQPGYGF